ncbi:MAG: ABC transporter transmembrane domain-containing protein, partial [Thermoproteus sp.]
MRLITHSVKLHLKFYMEFLKATDFNKGLATAMSAYMFRAVASGMFVPYAIQDITNGLYNESLYLINRGLWFLAIAGVLYIVTEWGFKPFWDEIARSIYLVKSSLVKGLKTHGDNRDTIGRLVNDVDFVMWNVGNVINTFVPNILTAMVAEITIFEMSPALGLAGLSGLPFYLIVLERYIKMVEEARSVERSAYSESIHAASEYLEGRGNSDFFIGALNKWLRGIRGNIRLDRIYWSSSFAIGYAVPIASMFLGIKSVERGRMSVGALIGALSASLTMNSALINAFWGICLAGQNVVPIGRILSVKQASVQQMEAPSRAPSV